MTDNKRKVEVFTAGCPLCDATVKLVRELSCDSCDIRVYDLNREGAELAKSYGVSSVPTVVVDGKVLACCASPGPSRESLVAAGIGTPV